MSKIANAPEPPYYAVIFTSQRTEGDNGYAEAAKRILELARQQPGFLGYEGARQDIGVSVSYWKSLEAIRAWKEHPEHRKVQEMETVWYGASRIRVCKVERDYSVSSHRKITTRMTGIAIHPLSEYARSVPRIAAWFFEEWRSIYGEETQESVQRRIETWLTPKKIPTALVAVADNQVIGTVALKSNELQFPYTPWLSGLFVVPQFRHKGIGALLVSAAENEAASLGIEYLHLYTPVSQAFYEGLGWSLIEHCPLPSGSVAVMSKRLPRRPTNHSSGPARKAAQAAQFRR